MKKFSLVIPSYNEEKNIPLLIERTIAAAKDAGFDENTFSLVLVENGSQDQSYKIMCDTIEKNKWQGFVQIIQIVENRGYGHGIMTGLHATRAEIIGWTHADLQCDPKNAFIAYELCATAAPAKVLIKGTRTGRARADRFVSRVFESIAYLLLGLKFREINAQPKIFPSELLKSLTHPPHSFALDLYLLYVAQKMSYKSLSIEVEFPPRIHGVSHWAANFAGRYKTIWGIILYMWKLRRSEGRA
jgi:glycosyltransferase involved in cell wall biosynthesis